MFSVYELRSGSKVEYVGYTNNTVNRLKAHTLHKHTPNRSNRGLFYGRTDITIHTMSQWPTRKEAYKEEARLKIHHGFEPTECTTGSKSCKRQRVLTIEQAEEIKSKYIPRVFTQTMLAKEYNVHRNTICRILYDVTYQET